mmetsp:Transcript_16111/g.61460  ORF Transcript_16111/g.61460 Transcript_16111/m.61460 type:complete len:219 (+) Transcript_16111:146-802(+)
MYPLTGSDMDPLEPSNRSRRSRLRSLGCLAGNGSGGSRPFSGRVAKPAAFASSGFWTSASQRLLALISFLFAPISWVAISYSRRLATIVGSSHVLGSQGQRPDLTNLFFFESLRPTQLLCTTTGLLCLIHSSVQSIMFPSGKSPLSRKTFTPGTAASASLNLPMLCVGPSCIKSVHFCMTAMVRSLLRTAMKPGFTSASGSSKLPSVRVFTCTWPQMS